MKFRCPECNRPVSLFSSSCCGCGFALTVGSVLRHYRGRVRERVNFRCPKCQGPVPLTAKACGHCGALITWSAAVEATVAPPRERLHRFMARADSKTKWRLRLCYLLFSVALLCWLLTYVHAQGGEKWVQHAALSAVFLAVFALLVHWAMPRHILQSLYWRAYPLTRLALVCNFLSAMMVLQLVIGVWWGQAAVLAVLFLVVWAAGFLFHRFLLPMAVETERVFVGPDDPHFDTQGPQGRKVRWD
jgi:hypothetical protein